jgi:hypothetical protein
MPILFIQQTLGPADQHQCFPVDFFDSDTEAELIRRPSAC